MAQQPHLERDRSHAPKHSLAPPAGTWTPTRPGEVLTPDAQVVGVGFGRPGPDIGFAYHLIGAHVPEDARSKRLDAVLVAVIAARASAIGRAPVAGDAAVAAALLGFGQEDEGAAARRRREVVDATAHEHPAGSVFVASVPADVLHGDVQGARRWVAGQMSQ